MVMENKTFFEYVQSRVVENFNPAVTDKISIFVGNVFEDLYGVVASAIMTSNSNLYIISNERSFNGVQHFRKNYSPEGATILAISGSTILIRNIRMADNIASKGGCIQIISSELDVFESVF